MTRSRRTIVKFPAHAIVAVLLCVNGFAIAESDPRAINLALLDAAKQGDIASLALKLKDGASVSTRDRFGNTALLYAARGGHTEIVNMLIAAGADAKQTSVAGNTPLFEAAGSGEITLVRLLLQQGNDPNTVNIKQVSPLANAIFHKRSDVAELLLRHGAQHDIIDSTGKSSAVYAAANGETEILRQILALSSYDRSTVDFRYAHNLTLLMWAAGYGNTETVTMLIDRGADLSLVDDRGKTALIMAEEKKHLDVVARLQGSGAR